MSCHVTRVSWHVTLVTGVRRHCQVSVPDCRGLGRPGQMWSQPGVNIIIQFLQRTWKFSPSRNMQIPPSNEWVAQTIALRSSKRLSCSPRSSKCLAAEQFSVLSLVLLKMQRVSRTSWNGFIFLLSPLLNEWEDGCSPRSLSGHLVYGNDPGCWGAACLVVITVLKQINYSFYTQHLKCQK